jgi:hypothetical protein
MANITRKDYEPWLDWVNLGLAFLLFISPWVFGFIRDDAAARDAWVVAIIVGVFAIAAIVKFQEWEEWINAIAGVWLVLSPWLLGFAAAIPRAAWTDVVLGIAIAAIAAWKLWTAHESRGRATA